MIELLFCIWGGIGLAITLMLPMVFQDINHKPNLKQKGFLFLISGPWVWVLTPIFLAVYFGCVGAKHCYNKLGE